MNEVEASLVIRAGAELLHAASSDPRSGEGYAAVKANLSAALEEIARALGDFESATSESSRSSGWAQDLRRVADDLAEH